MLPTNYKEGIERVTNIVSFNFPFKGTDSERRYKEWLYSKSIKEEEFLVHNAVENLHRKDINLFELGRTCDALAKMDLTISEIAARLTIPRTRVKNAINCKGNCSNCFECWNLKNKNVVFNKH